MNRAILTICLLSVGASLIAQDSIPTDYPVRDIPEDSEKFNRIYEAVAQRLYQSETEQLKTHSIEILQTIAPGQYRVEVGETTYAMKIPGKPLADGEIVQLPALETDEVFQYTTVLGATSTIKVAIVPEMPEKITKTQFVILLQGGKSFEIAMGSDKIRCDRCAGTGYRERLAKILCSHCGGQRVFETPRLFRVYW